MWRRWLAVLGVFVIAALLAFPLRDLVDQLILIPIAYLLWLLHLVYISMNQSVWWIAAVVLALVIIGQSLLPEIKFERKIIPFARRARGNVESLALTVQRSKTGIYFKWQVANRLGKLAYQILLQREHGKPRSVFAPLTGEGWEVEPSVRQYLEKGLHGSFAEFPNSRWGIFAKPQKTPLDHDVADVVEFLETRVESDGKPQGR